MRLPWEPHRWGFPGSGLQHWCAVALTAVGTLALASLIPFVATGRPASAAFPLNVLYAPAWFLFDSFLWFALLIPALCYAYVFALFSNRVTREVMAALAAVGLVLPVMSTLAHVVAGTDRAFAAVMLVAAFGRVPAATLLILILLLEGVAGFALGQRWRRGARGAAPIRALVPPARAAGGSNGASPAAAANGSGVPPVAAAFGMVVPDSALEQPGAPVPPPAPPALPIAGSNGAPPAVAANGSGGHLWAAAVEDDAPVAAPDILAPESAFERPYAPDSPAPPAHPVDGSDAVEDDAADAPDLLVPEISDVDPDPLAELRLPGPAASGLSNDAPANAETAPVNAETAPVNAETAPVRAETAPAAAAAGPAAAPPAAPAPPPPVTAAAKQPPRGGYQVPLEVLNPYEPEPAWQVDNDTREAAATLMATLAEFKIDAEVTGIRRGPVITMFELLPAPGVKISRIVNLADNIALRLAASRVRIVAPIPGKHAVGIEVPNRRRAVVSFREMVSQPQFTPDPQGMPAGVPIVLGKDITGEAQVIDLTATPHLLIAGATGAGKSVLVNALICSVLYSRTPEQVRLLLIDPKIVELKLYNDVPHLLTPVITDPKRAFQALQYCLYEMERRYALLDNLGVRDINSYNRKLAARAERVTAGPLPYLIIVIDEFADLMATTGKELEATLARLAAMARAVGIHIVLATQRPSIDVITGLIKANIPSRIAFMVASKFDSRIIIDAVGAEKLLGRGDMLFVPAWDANPLRIQGALVTEDEVELVTEKVRELGEPDYLDEDMLFDDEESELRLEPGGNDPLMDQALEVVAGAGKASASYLQRKLKIGYNRAARLVEEMEQRGIVGPANGSKPREILHLPSRD